MELSIVIPVYNGEKTIKKLLNEIKNHLQSIEYEVILVNDASKDNSEKTCLQIAENEKNITFISLRKNKGEHNAVLCGLNFVNGNYVAIIDDDFQNPPEEIIKLYNEAQKGFDVVYSKYNKKQHSFLRNLGSKINSKVATWLLEKPKHLYLSSFKIIKKEVVDEIIKYKGSFPYVDGLIFRVTQNISSVLVTHNAREEGKSNYTISKLLHLYLNMFINHSLKPVRWIFILGIFLTIFGLIFSFICLILWLLHSKLPSPLLAFSSFVVILFGAQISALGLVGEYIAKNYLEQSNLPQYTIKILKQHNDLQ